MSISLMMFSWSKNSAQSAGKALTQNLDLSQDPLGVYRAIEGSLNLLDRNLFIVYFVKSRPYHAVGSRADHVSHLVALIDDYFESLDAEALFAFEVRG